MAEDTLYGYTPTLSVCVAFIALFALSALVHGCEAVAFKLYFFLGLSTLACAMEVVGWIGRALSSFAPDDLNYYTIQIVATVIAPTPLLACDFIILGMLIRHFGEEYSRLSSKLYSIIFTSADGLALIIQAFGGAKASHAVSTDEDPEPGAHIMLVGIFIQMIAITLFTILGTEFLWRVQKRRPAKPGAYIAMDAGMDMDMIAGRKEMTKKIKLMVLGLSISTVLIFIRTIYRTVELINGFTGIIIRTQIYFNLGDGLTIVLAAYCLNFLHPGYLLADIIQEERRLKVSKGKRNTGKGVYGKTVTPNRQAPMGFSFESEPYVPEHRPYELTEWERTVEDGERVLPSRL